MDSNRRMYPRLPITIEVELYQPGQDVKLVQTDDLSHGGVLLLMEPHDRPPLDTWIKLRVVGTLGDGEDPPLVTAKVVRHARHGVAVKFILECGESVEENPE